MFENNHYNKMGIFSVTCVKFGSSTEEKLFWSTGKDGKIKQWDATKFERVQVLDGHTAEIRALVMTSDGNQLVIFCFKVSNLLLDFGFS